MMYRNANIRVDQSLDGIRDQSDSRDVLLTHQLLDPTDGGFAPTELDLLRRGTHNLASVAEWDYCYPDFERLLCTDQHRMDLVPAMFGDVRIIRSLGYKVAFWNVKTCDAEGFREAFCFGLNLDDLRTAR